MNEEDMADILQKLTSMMNNNSKDNNSFNNSSSNEPNFENIQEILSNMSSNSNDNNSNYNNNFNFDFNTFIKMKSAIDKFNSYKTSPEVNLLMSLKPYLNNNRKQKLDQYMQFLNLARIIESLNSEGEVHIK